jgi:hypothetical protein
MKIKGESPLCQKLKEFYQYTEWHKREINSLEKDRVALDSEVERFRDQIKQLTRDRDDADAAAINQLPVHLNDDFAQLYLDTKTELIETKIKSETETFKSSSNDVLMFIKGIQDAHELIRHLFSRIMILGHGTVITQSVSNITLDSTRVEIIAAPSPSRIDELNRPEINVNLTTELIGLEAHPVCFSRICRGSL